MLWMGLVTVVVVVALAFFVTLPRRISREDDSTRRDPDSGAGD